MTTPTKSSIWLHRYAVLTAIATLGLIAMGGLVTSKGVGMAVPDWPTSYGYNMFALPFSMWFTGGIFHEHTHRQWATLVGVMVVILTRWLGGRQSCKPLLIVGAVELLAGLALFKLGDEWKGAGGFLSGIGGLVLLAGIVGADSESKFLSRIFPEWRWVVWVKSTAALKRISKMLAPILEIFWLKDSPSIKPLPALGWWAFWLVQLQGLLGGLRVVLDAHVFAGTKLGVVFGLFHGCLAQGFFVVLCVIALFTSQWWKGLNMQRSTSNIQRQFLSGSMRKLILFTTVLISIQLIIGATMRHQHAGLAIPDFPLAYGKLWPDTGPDAVIRYNQQRMEVTAANPITSFQICLQMVHRMTALLILICVAVAAWRVRRSGFSQSEPPESGTPSLQVVNRLTLMWFGLILVQASLGAWTIWSDKAADVATLHVVVGALSLVTGAVLCIIIFRGHQIKSERTEVFSSSLARP